MYRFSNYTGRLRSLSVSDDPREEYLHRGIREIANTLLFSPLIISWKRFQRNLINPTISMARWDRVKDHNRVSYCALPWTGWAVHHTACTRYRLRTHSAKGIRRTVGAKITRGTRVEYDSVEEPSIFDDPPFPDRSIIQTV